MATKQAIIQRVGEELALVPVGQDLEAQDQARIEIAFDEVYARLKNKGFATWASTSEVPEDVVQYYALMMAEKLLTVYSVPDTRYQRIKADAGPDGKTAELMLADLTTPEYESIEEAKDY